MSSISSFFYSLIIPCYNEEDTIKNVVETAQQFVDEVIVVNDNSTDGTQQILDAFEDVIMIFNDENLGQEKSIEKGLSIAKGNVIILIDADLEHDPSDIPRFQNYFCTHDVDMIIGKRNTIPRSGEIRLNKLFEQKYQFTDLMNGFRLFKKKVFDEIGFYYKHDYFGLDFLMNTLNQFKVGQIQISARNYSTNPRI